ncbi:hypothetical protein B9Z55_012776 [Caenorhabditis nigoni]|uniref:Uncharacterized protein n=1 Tax=Caenorhabditis nigoni TaxID=1611254 RepID=A0A2G5TYU6_9PELO|nr:hypothetical protein B9Z55_012776 [Caenorhabditis nigoni]
MLTQSSEITIKRLGSPTVILKGMITCQTHMTTLSKKSYPKESSTLSQKNDSECTPNRELSNKILTGPRKVIITQVTKIWVTPR